MKKVVCIMMILFVSLMSASAVLAMNTDIHIKTLKDLRISIIVRETGKLTSLESFHKDTGDGTLNLVTSSSADSLDFLVTLRREGKDILNKKFTDNPAGFPVYINFIPGEVNISDKDPDAVVEIANETEINETEVEVETLELEVETLELEVEESEETETAPITGQAILGDGKYSKTMIYGSIVIIILVVVFLMFMFSKKGSTTPQNIKITKYSEMSRNQEDAELADAEEKLKQAQAEIEKLKHKRSELSEAEQEYERAKEKLERLKQGREDSED